MQFLLRVGLSFHDPVGFGALPACPFGVGIGSSKEREQRHSIALRISRRIEIRRVFLIAQNDALSVQWCSQAVPAGGASDVALRTWGKKTEVMLMILPYLSYLTVRSSDIPSILWPLTGQYTL